MWHDYIFIFPQSPCSRSSFVSLNLWKIINHKKLHKNVPFISVYKRQYCPWEHSNIYIYIYIILIWFSSHGLAVTKQKMTMQEINDVTNVVLVYWFLRRLHWQCYNNKMVLWFSTLGTKQISNDLLLRSFKYIFRMQIRLVRC